MAKGDDLTQKKIYRLEQLKDSQMLYDKSPPPFAVYMIFIVVGASIVALIWSLTAVKTYIIKSSGSVLSRERNYIMSNYTGEITDALVHEGDYVGKGDVLFSVSSVNLDLQEMQISGAIEENKRKIERYEQLEECVKSGVNTFDENNSIEKPYYYQYETYMNQVSQKKLDLVTYRNYEYSDEQIEIAINNNEAAIAEIYSSTLKSIADSVQQLQTEIHNYEVQLASIKSGQAEYPITASVSGIVHMDMEYKEGMVVQAAAAIGSIVSENDSYIAQVYTAANDMPLIHVGDHADVAISGLTQSIYGTIGGTVSYIASEATVNNENNTSAFLVKIDLDSMYLISNQGNQVKVSNGMAVEARIKYDEVTYFNYMLEALGILTR